jgi:hypothetical protein
MLARRFIYSATKSKCCGAKELVIRSRPGGMIGKVCLRCRAKSDHIAADELPQLQCEFCQSTLQVSQLVERHRNFFYICPDCDRKWKVGDFVPDWFELFPYSGLSADQDMPHN